MSTAPKAYTISYLAQELGRDRVKLGKVLAGVEPDLKEGERSKWLIKTVVDRLVDGKANAIKTDKDLAEQKLKDAKGEIALMDLKERQGKLVAIEEVQTGLRDVLSAVRSRILAIPTRLAKRLAGTQDAQKAKVILAKAVRSALEEISGYDPTKLKGGKR